MILKNTELELYFITKFSEGMNTFFGVFCEFLSFKYVLSEFAIPSLFLISILISHTLN